MKAITEHVVLFFAIVCSLNLQSQETLPGGVNGVVVWEITKSTQSNEGVWESKIENSYSSGLTLNGIIRTINYNPALFIPENHPTDKSTINLGELSTFCFFIVCQEDDTTSESVIFNLENDSSAEMVVTNLRMAALDRYRYTNYGRDKSNFPRIYSYSQNKSNDEITISRKLKLGQAPKNQHLPVVSFSGTIPEVILFERHISPIERQKVESYLALKYGVSLNQIIPLSYLSSKGENIWDAELNAMYNQNIAGIGRDNLTGLYQKTSESTQTPGVLKMTAPGELKNNSFLIWGDNGKPLNFSETNGFRKLQREWKISAFNLIYVPVNIETNDLSLSEISPLNEGEVYWMMIDENGTGEYAFRKTRYIKCESMPSSRGIIRFNSLPYDADSSGSDVFTMIIAPQFFTKCKIISPSCSLTESGIIQTEIVGGVPPFEITLTGVSNKDFQVSAFENEMYHVFEGISQGAYTLSITDSEKSQYTEDIWISNTHLWENQIKGNYSILEGEPLILDASKGMPAIDFSYSWITPDGITLNNEKITIHQPGIYLLSVTDENNCNSTQEICITQMGKSIFNKAELLPNPTDSWFLVRASLACKANLEIFISDMQGRILTQRKFYNSNYYAYSDVIHQPGLYIITLIADDEKMTFKLIVK